MERLFLSVAEVAEALGVSTDLVYDLIAQGDLPCVRLGARKVIPREVLDRLAAEAVKSFDARRLAARFGSE